MVNADRVKRKLPSLLVEGSTTEKKSWNSLMRCRYRFIQFKKQHPEKFNSITNRILLDLNDLDKAVNESNDSGRRLITSGRFLTRSNFLIFFRLYPKLRAWLNRQFLEEISLTLFSLDCLAGSRYLV